MRLAQDFGGEIICGDSRTVYTGMDIGTAKPTKTDQRRVRHHLLDEVLPNQVFTAFDFQQRGLQAIDDIRSRGNTPILVGGSGLYIDSIVFQYQFPLPGDKKEKNSIEALSLEELYQYYKKNNINLPYNYKNKRHLVNKLIRKNQNNISKAQPIDNTIIVGITTEKEILLKKIAQRIEHMYANGVVEEAKKLGEIYGWDCPAMTGNAYRLARNVLEGTMTIEQAKQKNVTLDWRLAKRQITWLKRNPYITWGDSHQLYQFIKKCYHKQ